MKIPFYLDKVNDLNAAMSKYQYERAKMLINDPSIPINLDILGTQLPASLIFGLYNYESNELVTECERVDWLALSSNRVVYDSQEEYKYEYERSMVPRNKTLGCLIETPFDHFCMLPENFESCEVKYAKIIYKKMIEELVKMADTSDYTELLFKTANSCIAFEFASQLCTSLNVRNKHGSTLLHCSNKPEIAALLLQRQEIDIEALDNLQLTPLMAQAHGGNWQVVEVLIQHGANVNFINVHGNSAFTVPIESKRELLKRIELSRELFVAELKRWEAFDWSLLQEIFQKYPEYKNAFEADKATYLPAIKLCPEVHAMIEELSEPELFCLLENYISRCEKEFSLTDFPAQEAFVKNNASDLLFVAVRADKASMAEELIVFYGADPNHQLSSSAETPLFLAGPLTIDVLLSQDADPKHSCNGLLFFERENFCNNEAAIDAKWLFSLHRSGFDLFSNANKSGKSVIEHLNPEKSLLVTLPKGTFQFPVKKLSLAFFDALSSSRAVNYFVPIDDEGNCLAHYLTLASNEDVLDLVLEHFSIAQLASVNNKAGSTPLLSLVKQDKEIALLSSVPGPINCQDFLIYLGHCEMAFPDFGKRCGGHMVLSLCEGKALDFDLIIIAIFKYGISMDLIVEAGGNLSVGQLICRAALEPANQAISSLLILFTTMRGYQLDDTEAVQLIRRDLDGPLLIFLKSCLDAHNVIRLVAEACTDAENPLPLNRAFIVFAQHGIVKIATHEIGNDFRFSMDAYFFKLCHNSLAKAKFLMELTGVNPKRLKKSRFTVKVAEFDYDHGAWEQIFLFLAENGWTLDDFKQLKAADTFDKFPLLEFFKKATPAFEKVFVLKPAARPFLSQVEANGDCKNCPICRDEFVGEDSVVALGCKHVVHYNCLKCDSIKCPICPAPVKRRRMK